MKKKLLFLTMTILTLSIVGCGTKDDGTLEPPHIDDTIIEETSESSSEGLIEDEYIVSANIEVEVEPEEIEPQIEETEPIQAEEETFTDKELDDMQYVDDTIAAIMEDVKDMDVEEKASVFEEKLETLKEEGYINNYNYDEKSAFISFTYNCDVLGGIMLKDFDPMMN